MPAKTPHVALLIESSREYGRCLLRGVSRYLRERGPWVLYFHSAGLTELSQTWLRDWRGDGILVRANTRRFAEAVMRSGLPAVELRFTTLDPCLPAVGIDSRAVAELAFRHLWDGGFRHLAFCGLPPRENIWSDFRGQCFARFVAETGRRCHVFPARPESKRRGLAESELPLIADWLAALPKPVGVMAWNDDRGQQVLEACLLAGVQVPDEVAVIGVDNDEFFCNLSSPPLSSVNTGAELVGYEAAALLDGLMAGRKPPSAPIFLPPLGVVVRQSTDVVASEDRELANLIRFIRENACNGLRVEEALRRSSLSQSTMQRRFKTLLGRTPKQEITRIQLERAKQLLIETELTIADIAIKCGFGELKSLSEVFRAKLGVSPLHYRRQLRTPN